MANLLFISKFFAGFARPGELLFFASPKKRTQKKGDAEGLARISMRVPCAPRPVARSPNSQALLRFQLAKPARQDGSLTRNRTTVLGQA